MSRFIAGCFVGVMALCMAAYAQEAKNSDIASLKTGKYELRLVMPQMAEGKRDIALPAEVEITEDRLLIKTQGMMGNKVVLNGVLREGDIKVGVTGIERENIISFHYIGKVATETSAKGKLYGFINGKARLKGNWVLTQKNEERQQKPE